MRLGRPLRGALLVVLAGFLGSVAAGAQERLAAAEARDHVGERTVVCGRVVRPKFAEEAPGSPTFLNLDEPYPRQVFTAVIWGRDRSRFPAPPERLYAGRRICVRGTISSDRGVAEIVVERPEQIEVVGERAGRAAAPEPTPAPPSPPGCLPRRECCRVCTTGQACGDSCISARYTCHRGRGCACNSREVCP